MTTLGIKYQLSEGTGARGEPLRETNYTLEIPKIGNITLFVDDFTCPVGSVDKMEVRYQNGVAYIAGKPQMSDGKITVRDVVDPKLYEELLAWHNTVYDPETDVIGYASDYKSRGFCHVNDSKGNVMRTFELIGLWPTKVSPGNFKSGNFEGRKIEIELSCDRFKVV